MLHEIKAKKMWKEILLVIFLTTLLLLQSNSACTLQDAPVNCTELTTYTKSCNDKIQELDTEIKETDCFLDDTICAQLQIRYSRLQSEFNKLQDKHEESCGEKLKFE
jgi:molecular chaperone GrpE (heat shock protein)